ncbi:MAG: hypothetical protein GXP55_16195 [Deltaproteobacteria bacterium]|nr:hypothetical protein [Deltaproteobacteria bacterium]
MRSSLRLVLALSVLLSASACGSSPSPEDAAPPDAAPRDARPPDARPRDAGPVCTPACSPTELCCADSTGAPRCINPREDVENCGSCGRTCLGGRGTECALGACVCGFVDIGCGGTDESICCPPRSDGGIPYCANLRTDGSDCGGCGAGCDVDQANFCAGAVCVCGDMRGPCTGAPDSRCCEDEIGFATCVDTTSDPTHCGSCGHRCGPGERCTNSLCSFGPELCPSGCADGEVCCRGLCCARVLCLRDACGLDAADAGAVDSGVIDAGAVDSGVIDAGAVGDASAPELASRRRRWA